MQKVSSFFYCGKVMLCSELPELLEFDLAVFSGEPRNKWKVEKTSYMLNT